MRWSGDQLTALGGQCLRGPVGAENLVHSVDLRPRIILNGWFFGSCFGALLLTALAAVLHLRADGRPVLPWIAGALVLYVVAPVITIGSTCRSTTNSARPETPTVSLILRAARERFDATWMRWNLARAAASTARWMPHLALVLYRRTVTPGRA